MGMETEGAKVNLQRTCTGRREGRGGRRESGNCGYWQHQDGCRVRDPAEGG